MSLNNYYLNRKDHRAPYYGAKAISGGCRNHGSCDWCKSNRLYKYLKREQAADQELLDWLLYNDEEGNNEFYSE